MRPHGINITTIRQDLPFIRRGPRHVTGRPRVTCEQYRPTNDCRVAAGGGRVIRCGKTLQQVAGNLGAGLGLFGRYGRVVPTIMRADRATGSSSLAMHHHIAPQIFYPSPLTLEIILIPCRTHNYRECVGTN